MLSLKQTMLKIPRQLPKRLLSTVKPSADLSAVTEVDHVDHKRQEFAESSMEVQVLLPISSPASKPLIIEGVQGQIRQKEISLDDARKSLTQAAEHAKHGPGVQGVQIKFAREFHQSPSPLQEGVAEEARGPAGPEIHAEAHQCNGTVSLHGCMQSNVPHPYDIKNNFDSFHNMPGGRDRHSAMYLSNFRRQILATSIRYISTSSVQQSSIQGTQARVYEEKRNEEPCPQGIQGDDCVRFQLWMESCRRYSLPNCDEQLQGIQEGRKTLAQVLMEQEEMIAKVAENYRILHSAKESVGDLAVESAQGLQGDLITEGGQGAPIPLPRVDSPCPQGIQGDDCIRFKLWLENCHKFGMRECSEDFQAITSGRKTLAEVFAEQEEVIRQVVELQKKNPEVFNAPAPEQSRSPPQHAQSQSSHLGDGSQDSGTGGGSSKLSQTDRLKKAVKEYGATVVVFHIGISLISLGGFYLAVSSGIDVVSLLSKVGLDKYVTNTSLAAGASTFVMAYAVHKVFAPVRIGITLTSAPFIVRYLRRIGVLKQPPTVK